MTFTPTEEQVRLAEAVFVAMAYESEIRPIVESYEQAILEKHRFIPDPSWLEYGLKNEPILDRKRTHLLSDQDSRTFFSECHKARDAAELKVDDPENCPLLVAENLRRDAEHALLKSISSIPGLESLGTSVLTLDHRRRAIDLCLKLLAPFCASGEQILERYRADL